MDIANTDSRAYNVITTKRASAGGGTPTEALTTTPVWEA
jgi:hypothetical protein